MPVLAVSVPPALPRTMLRVVLMTVLAVTSRIPPLRVRLLPAVAEPRLPSLLIASVPALIVVPPV